MEKGYRIRLIRDGIEFEAEGDKKFVNEMLERFDGGHAKSGDRQSGTAKSRIKPDATGKTISVREFMQKLGFKKHTDIGLAFGYYLEHYGGKASFTPADINNCYYDAKMETSNTSQLIIQNIKSGRMMDAKQQRGKKTTRKGYVLTQSGEQFVTKKLASTK